MTVSQQKVHELKINRHYFSNILTGKMNFELRVNDCDFVAGDILHLREWDKAELEYTGNEIIVPTTYILYSHDHYGIRSDYCILGLDTKMMEITDNVADATQKEGEEVGIS